MLSPRHCEERSDEAIHSSACGFWIASSQVLLAMTVEILALRTSDSHVLRGDAVERTDHV